MVRSLVDSLIFHIDPLRIRREGNKGNCAADRKRNELPRLFVLSSHREYLYKLTNDCRGADNSGPPKMADPA